MKYVRMKLKKNIPLKFIYIKSGGTPPRQIKRHNGEKKSTLEKVIIKLTQFDGLSSSICAI